MVAAYADELRRMYTVDRLARYSASEGDDLSMIVSYLWNIELCEALYPGLCALELTVRNSIHLVLSTHYGRPDWYDLPNVLQRDEARARDRTKEAIARAGKPVIPGRVVAGLNFGFWTGLLSSLYGNSPKGPQLWTSPEMIDAIGWISVPIQATTAGLDRFPQIHRSGQRRIRRKLKGLGIY